MVYLELAEQDELAALVARDLHVWRAQLFFHCLFLRNFNLLKFLLWRWRSLFESERVLVGVGWVGTVLFFTVAKVWWPVDVGKTPSFFDFFAKIRGV